MLKCPIERKILMMESIFRNTYFDFIFHALHISSHKFEYIKRESSAVKQTIEKMDNRMAKKGQTIFNQPLHREHEVEVNRSAP